MDAVAVGNGSNGASESGEPAGGGRGPGRRSVFWGAAALAGAASLTAATASAGSAATGSVTARTAQATKQVRNLKLYMERLPDGRMGYGTAPGKATVPGPLIEMVEGDTLHIEVENLMDVDASLHVHGVDYEISSDGTRMTRSHVPPGAKRTYTWRSHAPGRRADGTWRSGSAGYWQYHDHAVGTDHGTAGVRNGLYGALVVRRAGDVLPDRTITIVFNDMLTNNQRNGPDFEVTMGDRVEIISITHGELYHTFHIHGHRWAENRTGLLEGPDDTSRIVDNKITGPGDSFGFQIIAGEGVGPGAWMYHCHVQSHSDMGMAGLLLVKRPDGTIPDYQHHHAATGADGDHAPSDHSDHSGH
ncbi:multicopper oxidase domain-containing protein [Streptomyces carpaticus]|uniref:multicopper oxidase domain-containing protein n=1 Tax=Streptomyces TaxID=1883 RepID=UPI002204AA09|nr:multicopper oxidase domain-containing protein [Streptomyces carpaticus]